MKRFIRTARDVSLWAACAGIREPLLRWPAFTAIWLFDLPTYLVGAAKHRRLLVPDFWVFTLAVYCAAMRGAFVQ